MVISYRRTGDGKLPGILILKNKVSIKKITTQWEKGPDQRKLIESLGLSMDRVIKTSAAMPADIDDNTE